MSARQAERKTPINLNSKISDGINNRTLHSGGSRATLLQSQPSPLEYSYLDLQHFKGKFRFIAVTSPFTIHTGRAVQLQLRTGTAQSGLRRVLNTGCAWPCISVYVVLPG